MISGRGLGFTGGTLDKLESIPGFNTQQDLGQFRNLVEKHGLALIGQTKEICPADKKIYALRDVTGTVESLALISASIMSKKLAEGIDGLVLDVKFGSGAFMKEFEQAEALARSLMQIAVRGGKRVTAFLTDMNQPLGRMIGNSLEVEECLMILRGEDKDLRLEDTRCLSIDLSAAMISLADPTKPMDQARELAECALRDGRALRKFEDICAAQGGDLARLPKASQTYDVVATSDGYITGFHNEGLGYAAIALRAGRLKSDDVLDPVAGIEIFKKIGDRVQKDEPIARLYASDTRPFAAAEERLRSSVLTGPSPEVPGPLIRKILKETDL
jgi:pyrimidine-nucleoside phosphorylase